MCKIFDGKEVKIKENMTLLPNVVLMKGYKVTAGSFPLLVREIKGRENECAFLTLLLRYEKSGRQDVWDSHEAIQIRPKMLYKSTKGVFIKIPNEIYYLEDIDEGKLSEIGDYYADKYGWKKGW